MAARKVTPVFYNPDITAEVEVVTPELAREWLADLSNSHNRRVKKHHEGRLRSLISEGVFTPTGQSIVFGKGGELLDGQHRLLAISKSDENFAVQMIVVRGVDPEHFPDIDQGTRRTGGDALRIAGVEHYEQLISATLRYLVSFDKTGVLNNQLGGSTLLTNRNIVFAQEQYAVAPDLCRWVVGNYGSEGNPKTMDPIRKAIPPSLLAAVYYLVHREQKTANGRERCWQFFQGFVEMIGLQGRSDVRMLLRQKLIGELAKTNGVLDRAYVGALILKAWHFFATERTISRLQYKADERYPVIYRM